MTVAPVEQMARLLHTQAELIEQLTDLMTSDRETIGELSGAVTRLQDDLDALRVARYGDTSIRAGMSGEIEELRDELLTQSRGIETVNRFAHSLLDRLNGHIAREQEARA